MNDVFKLSTIAVLAYLVIDNKRNKLTIEEVERHIINVARNPTTHLSSVLRMNAERFSRQPPSRR